MDIIKTNEVIFKGPEDAIKKYRGEAISQLQILDNFMQFQGLKQCKRKLTYATGVSISCVISFGIRIAEIIVPSVPLVSGKTITIQKSQTYLLIVYGDPEEYVDINYSINSPVFVPEAVHQVVGI